MKITDINIVELGGMMPNQAHGRCAIDGQVFNASWYFRGRHQAWELRISRTPDSLVGAVNGSIIAHGEDASAGVWNGFELARAVIMAFEQANILG